MTEPQPPDEIDIAFGSVMAKTPIEIKKKDPEEERKTDEQIEEENKRLAGQLPPEAQDLQKRIEESKPRSEVSTKKE